VFLHGNLFFGICFGHVHAWALICWASDLPKLLCMPLGGEKKIQSMSMPEGPRFIKNLNKPKPSMFYTCIKKLMPYP
jgi:hypothetical protein